MVRSLSENHLRNNLLGLYFSIVERYGTYDRAEAANAKAGAAKATVARATVAKATEATKRGEDSICNNLNRYYLPQLFY
jgi:hypothetical protein